jgi:hypothetical protein
MGTALPVWLRSTLRVWSHYLAICLASIPAAILATILAAQGVSEQITAFISVPLALALAFFGWRLVDQRLHPKYEVERVPVQLSSANAINWVSPTFASAGLAIMVVMSHSSNPKDMAIPCSQHVPATAGNTRVLTGNTYGNSTAG